MKKLRPGRLSALLAAATAFGGRPAQAADGFALNRYDPAERGSDWFALESLDLRGHHRIATGVVGDWSHRPLVLYDGSGEALQAVLSDQLYAYLGASAIWFDRLRVGLSVPLVFVNQGEDPVPGAPTVDLSSGANIGDVRLSADVRLLGSYGDVLTLALGTHLYIPSGSSDAFTGDGSFRAQPHVLAAGKLGAFEYAGRTGVNVRAASDFAGAELGSEWVFAAAGGVRFWEERLLVGPELWGGTLVSSDIGVFDKDATPVEVLLGAHYHFREWRFGLGAGPGLSRGLGTPQLRALASLEWVQTEEEPVFEPPPAADLDGDGVLDSHDACPSQPGVRHPDPGQNGCPAPLDSDGDTILDDIDACPNERGEPSDDARRHGCPPLDTDADGVLDREDACITEAGPRSEDPARNGCPIPPDRDGDDIVDAEDACPERAGEASQDPAQHGCPRVSLEGDRVQVLDRIEFENAKAELRPESEPILEAVAKVLREHPEILRVEIQGHTDSRGKHASNIDLSKRRAAAVRAWLIEHGIDAARLTSQGFGPDRPIDSNTTDEGRQRNRRVEFHVVETSDRQLPAPAHTAAP